MKISAAFKTLFGHLKSATNFRFQQTSSGWVLEASSPYERGMMPPKLIHWKFAKIWVRSLTQQKKCDKFRSYVDGLDPRYKFINGIVGKPAVNVDTDASQLLSHYDPKCNLQMKAASTQVSSRWPTAGRKLLEAANLFIYNYMLYFHHRHQMWHYVQFNALSTRRRWRWKTDMNKKKP